ncbi:MAG: amidohydrolase [Gracilibacteraceae bacterium]|jgi:5-methylthioadenosine/S-adenosylhomocysteine deaminase|nr:amidohydrolase [Gracilibacteraceae bacterium]
MDILLKNAQIITLNDNDDVIPEGSIGIRDGRIDYTGEANRCLEAEYSKVIDCRGRTVMPGFVNAHNHLAMTMFRNYADDMKLMDWLFTKIFPMEDKLTDESVYWGSLLAMVEMIKSGTTTFADMYFFMESTARAVSESGMRAVLSRGLQGESGEEELDYRLRENDELFRKYHNSHNGRIKVMLAPHSVYTCSEAYLRKVAAKSLEQGIPVQIHLSESKEEVKTCVEKFGRSPVKYLEDLGLLNDRTVAAHCVAVDDADMDILASRKVNVVHNPGSNMKLASGAAPVFKMLSRGINVCLGTDGASSNNNLDMLEEMRLAAYLQKILADDPTVLPADTVMRMATSRGARALGFEGLGSIETGKAADMIVLNTEKAHYYPKYNIKSAIVYSGNSADVETVIIDGSLIMENGHLVTLDEERILYEAQKCALKLCTSGKDVRHEET